MLLHQRSTWLLSYPQLLDASETALEKDVQLVEAVFGRIKIFGGAARKVLDEPFALKTNHSYFREKDPSPITPETESPNQLTLRREGGW